MSTVTETTRTRWAAWVKWLVVTVIVAIIAYLISPIGPVGTFWRPTHQFALPKGTDLVLYVILNIIEVLAVGFGVSYLAFGYSTTRRLDPMAPALGIAAYISLAWFLISLWIEGSLQLSTGFNLAGLLAIQYTFHLTQIAAGVILIGFVYSAVRHMLGMKHE